MKRKIGKKREHIEGEMEAGREGDSKNKKRGFGRKEKREKKEKNYQEQRT